MRTGKVRGNEGVGEGRKMRGGDRSQIRKGEV